MPPSTSKPTRSDQRETTTCSAVEAVHHESDDSVADSNASEGLTWPEYLGEMVYSLTYDPASEKYALFTNDHDIIMSRSPHVD